MTTEESRVLPKARRHSSKTWKPLEPGRWKCRVCGRPSDHMIDPENGREEKTCRRCRVIAREEAA